MKQREYNEQTLPRGFGHAPKSGPRDHVPEKKGPVPGPGGPGRPGGGRPGRGGGPRMAMVAEKPKSAKATLLRLIRYFGREQRLLYLLVGTVTLVTVMGLCFPALQGAVIDRITKREWEVLPRFIIAMLAVIVVNVLGTLGQSLISAFLSQRIVRRLRQDLFEKIVRLPIQYVDTHSNGDIMSRMTNDVENISMTVSQSLGSLISGVLTVVGTVVIMLWYCWQLTLVTMFTVVLTVLVTKKLSGIMRRVYRRRSQVLGALNGHSEEMITGYKTIVAYNEQQPVKDTFNETSDELAKVSIRAEVLGGSMGPIMNCISNIGFVIVAAFGGYFALRGIITVGTISAFIIYAKQFTRPINEIAQLYGTVQTAIAGAERVFELIDHPSEDRSGDRDMEHVRGEVSFRNVDFSYVPEKQVLHDFSLDVRPGEKVALVGATGSGKTTVVNLLMRFYDINAGQILIDGVDIRDISRDELRRNTAIVLQDTVLFSDTVETNIKYANMEASQEQVEAAAHMSNADFFIRKLPKGYQTFLKQAGSSLSQGQQQLLAIARAVLANPKILILDEATSSVDTRTEKHIQDAMVKLMGGRTSLIIAHRLSTIRDADKIVVMDQGRVVEMGNHAQLLEKKGRYYELYMTQFEGNET